MTAEINLIYNGVTYKVLCNVVQIGGNKNVDVKPYTNSGGPVEGQTLSYENLTYTLQGVHYTGESGTLTWPAMLSMYRHGYDGDDTGVNGPIVLNVTYGNDVNLVGTDGVTTDIRVLVKSFSLPIDAKDSRNGYLPIGNITLVETK